MYCFGKKSLEKLNHPKVHPDLKRLLLQAIQSSPIDFTIIETVRTEEQQKINVAKGVSKTMKSRHIPTVNKSKLCEAVDVAPYPINWKDIKSFIIVINHIKKIAKQMNIAIECGADWKTFKDYPHIQLKTS